MVPGTVVQPVSAVNLKKLTPMRKSRLEIIIDNKSELHYYGNKCYATDVTLKEVKNATDTNYKKRRYFNSSN